MHNFVLTVNLLGRKVVLKISNVPAIAKESHATFVNVSLSSIMVSFFLSAVHDFMVCSKVMRLIYFRIIFVIALE